ncbi:V-type ATP synthase subunit E [Planctomycetota bacterium]
MALSDIIDKIIRDTDQKITGIKDETDDIIDKIIAECDEECDKIREQARYEGEQESADQRKRMKIEVNLETRKELLKGRMALIDQVFEEAKTGLYTDEERYKQFLENQIFKAAEVGNEKVIFSLQDHERFSEGLQQIIASVNERLYEDDRKGELVLTNERGDFNGGFVLKRGRARTIMTLDSIISDVKDMCESEVAAILMDTA